MPVLSEVHSPEYARMELEREYNAQKAISVLNLVISCMVASPAIRDWLAGRKCAAL